jgi:hypothetical protein
MLTMYLESLVLSPPLALASSSPICASISIITSLTQPDNAKGYCNGNMVENSRFRLTQELELYGPKK